MVKERFTAANVFFAVDKLVSAAVKQIQKGIGKIGDVLSFIPGMSQITSLAQYFVALSLGYVDECCLGYTFYKKDQGAFKSAADGVVIYAQNWKTLLGNAAKTMLMVIIGLACITLVLFVLLGLLFRVFEWPGWIAFVISVLIALAIKFAFVDSFILTRTMVAYMGVAPTTEITYDLYDKLCKLSSKFKSLFNKGQEEQPMPNPAPNPVVPAPSTAGAGWHNAPPPQTAMPLQASDEKPVFCGSCGAKNTYGVKFCGSCGAPIVYIANKP